MLFSKIFSPNAYEKWLEVMETSQWEITMEWSFNIFSGLFMISWWTHTWGIVDKYVCFFLLFFCCLQPWKFISFAIWMFIAGLDLRAWFIYELRENRQLSQGWRTCNFNEIIHTIWVCCKRQPPRMLVLQQSLRCSLGLSGYSGEPIPVMKRRE